MKIVQVLNDKVHWVTDFTKDNLPDFAENIILVEAPDEVQEGWHWLGDDTFKSPDDLNHYVQIDDDGVVLNEFDSFENLEVSSNLIKFARDENSLTQKQFYLDGSFLDLNHYIVKRFNLMEDRIVNRIIEALGNK